MKEQLRVLIDSANPSHAVACGLPASRLYAPLGVLFGLSASAVMSSICAEVAFYVLNLIIS